VVVGDVGDVDGKLMIDGVDVHAVIFLIALMFYSYSLAVGPTSSLARGPPISEDLKCARWKVSPIQQWWVYLSMRVRLRYIHVQVMCFVMRLGCDKD
jgi:hypothetical protein